MRVFATPADPLAVLAADERVDAATSAARAEIDALLWRRDVRNAAADVAAASVDRGGRDSAAIDGADIVAVDDSPMGRVLDAALRVTAAVPTQVDVFEKAPLQVLARLHSLAAHGFLPEDELGRPRSGETADDPLRFGPLPAAAVAADRLMGLAGLLTTSTQAPALIVAAIAHAEIVAARPFAWGSGLIGRAVVRLVLASRGVDPSLFSIPEHGFLQQGRPAYVKAIRAYATGTPDGVADYLVWHATSVALGAKAVVAP